MDRFIPIDPAKRLQKTVVADRDGALIELYPDFMSSTDAHELYKELKNLAGWRIGEVMTKDGMKKTSRLIMGLIHPEVKTCNRETTGTFPPLLLKAHDRIRDLTGETFNYAYLNLYRDGHDLVNWHSNKFPTN